MRIWLSRPHMGGAERSYVDAAFDSNFIAPLGPQLQEFEERFAEYLGEGVDCLGLSSGSAALHLALHMLDLSPGAKVWVSSMTFAGGCFPILYERAEPVFFDLDPGSWTLCPDLVEAELKAAAKTGDLPAAIVPTDLYGQSCHLDRLEALAAEYGVPLIVDSAESAGAEFGRGRKAGTGGTMSILSFNGNKIITTGGGGMLVSRDRHFIDRARFLSTQARDPAPHYEHSVYGFNYRMGNIPAAIGLGQLEVLDARAARRREIFATYEAALGGMPGIAFMPEPSWSKATRWLTAMQIDPAEAGVSREDIRLALLDHEIESRPLWKPMHMQPLFEGSRYVGRGFDESLFANGLCLPSSSDMTDAEQDEVISVVRAALEG
ncbi:pyridoxal phosphate-dependent aminotransferase [Pacificimonas flava]|uniref:Pyridoxal phosphate-dependent aminotransferase n=2 Tax=Pacificimonas TaxID=1960290 RepID=A0A219B3L8_9SPHN|nr:MULTISPECIES: aminotransferase class I/II-fold pyridoxal phosphate-dependent enzyme [Pacificimonas]MBZ6377437.1 aminotransferase class I/II-fold pyridoxal phosphate-dependent enzyme [Pacificimonas aurantium]OWV32861.1 pyridoxal phosphate-dependent aminotransferase [Pacificimonas flava]